MYEYQMYKPLFYFSMKKEATTIMYFVLAVKKDDPAEILQVFNPFQLFEISDSLLLTSEVITSEILNFETAEAGVMYSGLLRSLL